MLAALANAVLLFAVAAWVVVEAIQRFRDPTEVLSTGMLGVAVAGLVANIVAYFLLRGGAKESINVRGAYLEVLGDTLGSVGVIVAALIIEFTGWRYADLIVTIAVGLFILPRTGRLARDAVRILVQAAPAGMDIGSVATRLDGVDGVEEVHDLHLWTLTSGMDVASAHLALRPGADLGTVLTAARLALHDDYGIDHATLQVEPAGTAGVCHQTGW